MADPSIISDVAFDDYNNHYNNYAAPHQRRNLSPLEIPELLDKIFSYIDEATLAYSVVLVSRQWFHLNRSCIVREAVVDRGMTDEELDVVVRTQLPVARRLYWYTHHMYGKESARRLPQLARVVKALEVKHRRWEEILAVRGGCRGSDYYDDRKPEERDDIRRWSLPEAPLQELIVAGKTMGFDSQLLHLLPSLSYLTVLRIETDFGCDLRLKTIFRSCPVLQEVALRPKVDPWHPDPFLDSDDLRVKSEFSTEGGQPLLHLRVFILEYHYVWLSTLLDFLSATPRLTDLQLVRLRVREEDFEYSGLVTGSFDEEEVMDEGMFALAYEVLETLCRHLEGRSKNKDFAQPLPQQEPQLLLPLLKNLHLSVETVNLETKNPQRLLKLCPSLQSSTSTDCLRFPGRTYNSLQQRLQMAPQNLITTLDLRTVSRKEPFYGDELHYYMCESPHLLHLLAPRIQMRVNQMDVYRRMRGTRLNAASKDVGLVKPRPGIWACRKLRTLDMAFSLFPTNARAMAVKPLSDRDEGDGNGRQYRILYGYLSIVCPSLLDLNLNLELMQDNCFSSISKHLDLRMGLVLLSRLRGLERLSFQGPREGLLTGSGSGMTTREGVLGVHLPVDLEIDWMVAGPSEEKEAFCSVERQEAWREFWESQEWERLIQKEKETDGLLQEGHRVAIKGSFDTIAIAAAVASHKEEEANIKHQIPKQCTDYEEMMKKLENLGLLLDIKLLLDEIMKKREQGTYKVWPMMQHASVFGNRECPFGRTVAQEFLTRHQPPQF
ncbi:hypothetical protein BGZ96_005033 [Linnemannia gamsii]|uniref:F-box domain-containing protein n=1 Tax=Linnemannia gamsii TaxID=64522 RepID=A0ABQ7K5J1_9FUNG|nr:hypothetical protein BGZ96_005033 [Linnemannia gamsii]